MRSCPGSSTSTSDEWGDGVFSFDFLGGFAARLEGPAAERPGTGLRVEAVLAATGLAGVVVSYVTGTLVSIEMFTRKKSEEL